MTDQKKKLRIEPNTVDQIVDALRTENPNIRLFQINIVNGEVNM
jgi:hypothetical protein